MAKVLLFNPRSANAKYRIPNSILAVAASIEGLFEYVLVDGNLENDPYAKIESYLQTGTFSYVGFTVMPGPQLKQAIPFTYQIKKNFPGITMIWGGYFASNQYQTVLASGVVDVVVNGPGDTAFPQLLTALEHKNPLDSIKNLIFLKNGIPFKTPKEELLDQDALPPLPYTRLESFYPMSRYLGKTFLGQKTIAYHSSMGCPFTCSFCAVVPIYEARWKGKSAENIYADIRYLKDTHGADAIEFHDNNFFVSEKRVVAFAELVKNDHMGWWGEARIDTMDKYSDQSLEKIREGGCKMIFYGAETGNDELLKKMDKGGKQNRQQIISFAGRLAKFDIIPEYSFVLGTPADSPEEVEKQIHDEINFIREIKEVNPKTEIIIYTFSPVPTEGSELYEAVLQSGFRFPKVLTDWLDPQWENFDLRKNPMTPWLKPYMIDTIKNFETVLNGYYPSVSDRRLTLPKRKALQFISSWRYHSHFYSLPYEIKLLHKVWKYRQPEIEGF